MVLTNAQTASFFTDAVQMGLSNATVNRLVTEGITAVSDLSEFKKEDIDNLATAIRRDPAGITFGVKSQKRLIVSANLIRYYELIGRAVSHVNMKWDPIGKNFEVIWKALEEKAEKDEPDVPKITKQMSVMRWSNAFDDHLHACLGVTKAPLAWIIRPEAAVPAIGPQAASLPYSAEHGSIEEEMINRVPFTHPLYRNDNETVYQKLEEATRNTQYAAAIAPYKRLKDGRGAHSALISQFAGDDKWEAEYKAKELVLHTWKWKGHTSQPLETFISIHRNCYVSMTQCAQKITVQLPNEFSRVGYLLDAIESADPQLQAALAQVRQDKTLVTGLRNNFENAVAHLMPSDPVARKRNKTTTTGTLTSVDSERPAEATVSAFGDKSGKGQKTGVDLRYHTDKEYVKLTAAQKNELWQWRRSDQAGDKSSQSSLKRGRNETGGDKKTPNKTRKVRFDKKVLASVESAIDSKLKAIQETQLQENMTKAYIQGVVSEMTGKKPATIAASTGAVPAQTTTPPPVPSLTQIMERVKNSGGPHSI